MRTSQRSIARNQFPSWVALAGLLLLPRPAHAGITLSLFDVVDPVPPGGPITYRIRVNNNGTSGGSATGCFNPPPECIAGPAQCQIPAPQCVGNSFTGFACNGAANDGDNCGVGDPPVADVNRCVPLPTGSCVGGTNGGLPCNTQADCAGQAFSCVRAFNEGAFCGTGSPPVGDPGLCIANPTGICASGENFGEECLTDEDCPDDNAEPQTDLTSVILPIPANTFFLDADQNGTSDGTAVHWQLRSEPCAGPGGISGTPLCPVFQARLQIDPAATVGSEIQNVATALPPDGTPVVSNAVKTTVGTFRLARFFLGYIPNKTGRDRLSYRVFITLGPDATLDPLTEGLRIQIDTPFSPLVDLALAPGQLQPSAANRFSYNDSETSLRRVILRQVAPSQYLLRIAARGLTMPLPDDLNVNVTVTLGDDVLVQPISLLVKSTGRKYAGLQ